MIKTRVFLVPECEILVPIFSQFPQINFRYRICLHNWVMTGLPERDVASTFPAASSTASIDSHPASSGGSEQDPDQTKPSKASSWTSIFSTPFSISDVYSSLSSTETKERRAKAHGWTSSVRRAITCVSMRRLQERILGIGKTDVTSSGSEVWLLGACYGVSSGESSSESAHDEGLSGFLNDFSSRIWITYRKGQLGV